MEISDLVGIGRLGRLEPDGFYHVQFSQPYKNFIDQLQECFLIFSSHRVFYVTVIETKTVSKRDYLRFKEEGIAEECKKTSKVIVALAEEDLEICEDDDEVKSLIEFKVHYLDAMIGEVADAMINPMQSVLIIALDDDRELLVPNVEHYVYTIDRQNRIIFMQNLELLLEICTSKS
jgi:ribosomal 30S subunit maturation factor RimM